VSQVLVPFALDLVVFVLAFRLLTAPELKYSTTAQIAGVILVGYVAMLGTLWVASNSWALPAVALAAALATLALRADGLARLTDALGRHRFPLYVLSVAALAALIFVLLPIRTFHTSPGELSVHLNYLMTVNASDAMVIVYAAALLYATAITSRMKTALALLAVGALSVGLVYSYVLPFGYPKMTGLLFEGGPMSQGSRVARMLCDGTVIVVVGLTLRATLLRNGARPLLIAVVLVSISLSVTAAVDIRNDTVGGAGGPDAADRPSDRPLRFSRGHPNALLIFLDRFMGSYVESTLAADPELGARLSGFTWYPRTVSAGENSIAGVHPMLGGYDYTPGEMNARGRSLRDLSVEAFAILPDNFSKKGYRVNIVNPRGLGFTLAGDCSFLEMDGVYCTHIPETIARQRAAQMGFPLGDLSESSYTDLLVLLSSMRGAPYGLKEVLHKRGPWRPFMDHSAGTTFTQWAELRALDVLSYTSAEEPNFNFISNILPHESYYMGENCLPQRALFELSDDEVRRRGHVSLFSLQHANAARCALLVVSDYLQFLKTAGVYNNTKIVIVSDHGIVGAVEDHSARAIAGGTEDNLFVRTRSLLLVKDRGATGPLRISEEFMPNAEVPRILCEEIGGCVNPYLGNKPIQALGRDDPFVVSLVPWQFTLQTPNGFVIDQQLELTGRNPFDAKGWKVIKSPTTR
jgi:hypothetical protein